MGGAAEQMQFFCPTLDRPKVAELNKGLTNMV